LSQPPSSSRFDQARARRRLHDRDETPSGFVRVTKGPGSRAAGVATAVKLIKFAQARWGVVNAPHLVALVPAGARFASGQRVERRDESGGDQQAA
jgi:hypothetical protein